MAGYAADGPFVRASLPTARGSPTPDQTGHAHSSLEKLVFHAVLALGATDEAQDLRPCFPTCLAEEGR